MMYTNNNTLHTTAIEKHVYENAYTLLLKTLVNIMNIIEMYR